MPPVNLFGVARGTKDSDCKASDRALVAEVLARVVFFYQKIYKQLKQGPFDMHYISNFLAILNALLNNILSEAVLLCKSLKSPCHVESYFFDKYILNLPFLKFWYSFFAFSKWSISCKYVQTVLNAFRAWIDLLLTKTCSLFHSFYTLC